MSGGAEEGRYSGRRTRRNAGIFLVGKVVSAIATVALLGSVVRALALQDYAHYVALIAFMETGVVFAMLGVEWMILRNAHEFVVHRRGDALGKFIARAAWVRLGACSLFALLGYVLAPLVLAKAGPIDDKAVLLTCVLLVLEGLLRLLRDHTLESLAAQSWLQAGTILRSCVALVGVIVWSTQRDGFSLSDMLIVDVAASALALVFAVVAVTRSVAGVATGGSETWQVPTVRSAWPLAINNYLSGLLSHPYSLQALTLVVSMFAAAPVVAGFGFAMRLAEIVRGYLPALLLMSVLRPRLFGIYAATGDFLKVAREAQMAHRMSGLMVIPLVLMLLAVSEPVIRLASGGRFGADVGYVLAAVMVTLVPRVIRQVFVALVNCVQQSSLLIRPALWSVFGYAPLLAAACLLQKPFILVLAVLWDECVWVVVLKRGLNMAGHVAESDRPYLLRLSAASIVPALLVLAHQAGYLGGTNWMASVFMAAAAALLFVVSCFALGVLRPDEVRYIRSAAGR